MARTLMFRFPREEKPATRGFDGNREPRKRVT